MKQRTTRASWIIGSTVLLWSIVLLLLISPSVVSPGGASLILLTMLMALVLPLTILSTIMLVAGQITSSPRAKEYTMTPLVKTIALLIIACVVVSVGTAIRSFWFSPLAPDFSSRFVFENIAVGTSFAAIGLTLLLSNLQADVYWLRRKNVVLDERQLSQRHEVFEASYKISVVIIIILVIYLRATLYNVPAIMANNYGSLPVGHITWIGIDLITLLVAMPLLVASLRRQK